MADRDEQRHQHHRASLLTESCRKLSDRHHSVSLMAQSRRKFNEGYQIDDLRSYVVLKKDLKSICRVKCSKLSIAIPENWSIKTFMKEDEVPSELHSALIHPASVDDHQKYEWKRFMRFLKTNKKVACANNENGDLYIIPPLLNDDFSHAVVKYLMHHQHTVTRTQTHTQTERPADFCSLEDQPVTQRVETCTRSVTSAKETYNRSVTSEKEQTRQDEEIGDDGFQSERPKRRSFKDTHMGGLAPSCYTGDNLQSRVEICKTSVSSPKEQTRPVKNYVCVNPSYLKTLGQTHSDWIFGAIAELVDNSRDAKATKLDISIDMIHPNISGEEIPMLEVVDDGHGMVHEDVLKMLMFGRKQSDTNDPNYIGTYGIGFKTATMRLGKDALVLTQTTHSRSIAFLSQSLNEGKDNLEIPIVTYNRVGQLMELDTKIQSEASAKNNLKSIMDFSPFNEYFIGEKAGLFERKGTGTHIYVWNLDKWGSEYSLEWDNGMMKGGSSFHHGDILIRSHRARSRLGQMTSQVKLDYSLRSYLEVIFLDPRIKIAIQGSLVKSRPLAIFLHKTSIKTGIVSGKPVILYLGRSQVDLENGNSGIFLYWRGRLIEAYKRVGSMIYNGEKSHGIVGVIDVTDVMDNGSGTVVHNNKQGFVECETYSLLKDWLSEKADKYMDETIDKVHVKRGRPRHKPDHEWVQCDKCRKWKKLPPDFNSHGLPQEWFCYLKPIHGNCEMPEEKQQDEVITIASGRKGYKRKENAQEEQQNNEFVESIHDHATVQVLRRAPKRQCRKKRQSK